CVCVCVGLYDNEVCVCVWLYVCVCVRSEEHTSELLSHLNLVCRLLLEKKITQTQRPNFVRESLQQPCEHHWARVRAPLSQSASHNSQSLSVRPCTACTSFFFLTTGRPPSPSLFPPPAPFQS